MINKLMKNHNNSLRIAIDGGNFIPSGQVNNGIQRLLDSFIKGIIQTNNKNYTFNYYYFGANQSSNLHLEGVKKGFGRLLTVNKLPKRFFASLHLPYNIIKDKNNVFLGFSGYLPKILQYSAVKKIIFIHDLGFIKFPKLYFDSSKLLRDTTFAVEHADKLIVFSDYVKKELIKNFPNLIQKKIIRIYAGINHLLPYRFKKNYQKYFLYVGVIKPIKNIQKLLKIFNEFSTESKNNNYKLVLIGPKEINYFNDVQSSALFRRLKNKLIFIENVSDSKLINYYLNATAVLNVSLEEGFCYPVVEALNLGKKVIVNELPIYKEYIKHFFSLLIGNTDREIIGHMIQASSNRRISTRIKCPNILTWNHFAAALLNELTL